MKKSYHILFYVEKNSDKLKKFKTLPALHRFMDKFLANHQDNRDDNWIMAVIPEVTGEVVCYEPSLKLE